ncbi:ArsR family transcriptional regulator [Cryobacterium sinapicolor]|uniref:ArsR family transcriptional regulator n=2 Tax=Cryobacterium sinapicolor TaxID=1259236 RepID=A0ABY2IYW7_9MICO|nr:ArsR family transcriptional regulator [Cryobacterium sinapicolor]
MAGRIDGYTSNPTLTLSVRVESRIVQLRQNEGMPRYASPEEPLPLSAERATVVFGANPLRGAIIRLLALNSEGMTSGAIQRELNTTYQTVLRHLQELESAGTVTADAGEQRQGQRVIYVLDTDALQSALFGYGEYLFGK